MDDNIPDLSDLIGLPFELDGRYGKTAGIDCYGVLIEVQRRLGRRIPDMVYDDDYEWQFGLGLLQAETRKLDLSQERLKLGDVGIMGNEDEGLHVAVALNSEQLIHTMGPRVRVNGLNWFKMKGMEFYTWAQ